jgi:hypothetical protein
MVGGILRAMEAKHIESVVACLDGRVIVNRGRRFAEYIHLPRAVGETALRSRATRELFISSGRRDIAFRRLQFVVARLVLVVRLGVIARGIDDARPVDEGVAPAL